MKKSSVFLMAGMIAMFAASCSKDDVGGQEQPKITKGLYVLNEGLFSQNNTTLTFYNAANNTTSTDVFATANGSGLGDTGNDLIIYGAKIYIVMNGSSYVQVSEAATAKSLRKIELKTTSGAPRLPRYALPYKNKVLVSSYDGTVAVIDTNSLQVEKFITVGANPEMMAIAGDRLFVSNSGGFNPIPDSTVSVVDLTTMTEIRKITVGVNPGGIAADEAGNVYVACTGNYGSIKPSLVKFNAATGSIIKKADTTVGKMRFYEGQLLVTGGYLGVNTVRLLNTNDFKQASPNFVTDGTAIVSPYGLTIDNATGEVFVTDAKNYTISGEVFCFDKTGKKKYSFSVSPGVNPNSVGIWKE
ncbi:YncE family protein [Flavitalea antarctica]